MLMFSMFFILLLQWSPLLVWADEEISVGLPQEEDVDAAV